MEISAGKVKELRDKTGAGMMDCKKALTEAEGDFEKAIEILRKKGAAVAAKRAERSANEGLILTKVFDGGQSAIMLEVNCETDFVANSDDFINFANLVLNAILATKVSTVEEILAATFEGKNIGEELNAIIGKIGEKIEVKRFKIETAVNGLVVDYLHHGAKLGVLLRIDGVDSSKAEELTPIARDIAMQVAAMKPGFTYREEVPKDLLDKEIEIYKELARKEGKPEQILEKIATGKLGKYYEENCLVEQFFVKDNTKRVGDLISEFNKKNGTQAKLVLFHRFHLSDEKK
jgi:elongation factor Ts